MHNYYLNLSIFDGDGTAAAGASGDSVPGENEKAVDAGRRNKANAEPDGNESEIVENGEPDAESAEDNSNQYPSEETDENNTENEENESFDDLINGRFKAEFEARVQKIINSRFKQTKKLEAENKSNADKLAQLRRNVGVSTDEELLKLIGEDNDFFNQKAYENNMEPEVYRKYRDMQEKAAKATEEIDRIREQERINEKARSYGRMEAELRKEYPGFDLRAELADENTGEAFYQMLEMGIGMKEAYNALHPDTAAQRTEDAMKYARRQGAKEAADSIKARAARPSENGSGGNASGVKYDVANMTRAQREELGRRALFGEKIKL